MPSVKIVDILKQVRDTLYDVNRDGWTNEELLGWYNAATIAIASRRPDACFSRELFLCDGSAVQQLPSGSIRMVRVDNNEGGDAVRFRDRDTLDRDFPSWMNDEGDEVEYFTMDDRYPTIFYVYPKVPAGHQINIVFVKRPAEAQINDFETDEAVIGIEDSYRDAIFDYVCFRAYSKDAEFADSAQRAGLHFNAFNAAMGEKTKVDAGLTPTNG